MPHENMLVELGRDPSVLFIVFSGADNKIGAAKFEFQQTTARSPWSRILCRDPNRLWYHEGLDDQHCDILSTAEWLKTQVDALAPRTVFVVGNSTGGYAALLFGHLLKAQYVHAFSPQTCLERDYVRRFRRLDTAEKIDAYNRLWSSTKATRRFFDLAGTLRAHNGRTSFFVHYCRRLDVDKIAAERLLGTTGLYIVPHDCDHHLVGRYLYRTRLLAKLLHPQLQEQLLNSLSRRTDDDGPPEYTDSYFVDFR